MRWTISALALSALLVACVSDDSNVAVDSGASDVDAGCASPMTVCTKGSTSTCTDTSSDSQNCGLCNTVCPTGTTCSAGKCACAAAGQTNCSGACVDTQTDPKNCGVCGNACIDQNCKAGECDRVVFVTDVVYAASLTTGSDPFTPADADCNTEAQAKQLPGKYKAWLAAGSVSPATRFTQSKAPYVLVDGTLVADDWTSLTSGTLKHAIDLTPQKITLSPSLPTRRVMTNVAPDGTTASPPSDCTGWTTSDSSQPVVGDPTATTADWTHLASPDPTWTCSLQYRLYCLEQ
ncbi:MAG TPA: hypothetical protein VGH28_28885 [Polyangiaceae bacterium]